MKLYDILLLVVTVMLVTGLTLNWTPKVLVEPKPKEWCLIQIVPSMDNSEYFGWTREEGKVARIVKHNGSWEVYQRCNDK